MRTVIIERVMMIAFFNASIYYILADLSLTNLFAA